MMRKVSWWCRQVHCEGVETFKPFAVSAAFPWRDFDAQEAAEAAAFTLGHAEHLDDYNAMDRQRFLIEVETEPGVWERYRVVCRVKVEYEGAKE